MNIERNPTLPITIDHEIKALADCIHATFCKWNHADGCDWFYHSWVKHEESGGKIGYARAEYAKKAQAVVDVLLADGVAYDDIDFDLLSAVITAAGKL